MNLCLLIAMCWCWCLVSICSMVVVLSCCPQLGGRGRASASHLANTQTANSRNTSSVFNIIAYWKIEKNHRKNTPCKHDHIQPKLSSGLSWFCLFCLIVMSVPLTGIHQRSEHLSWASEHESSPAQQLTEMEKLDLNYHCSSDGRSSSRFTGMA